MLLDDLIGPIVFRREITDLSGSYLADYETVTLRMELLEQEREEYQAERGIYDANVAVMLSGSGSVREHVQRLGRIVRRAEGKHATLRELISASTAEEWVSQRRREHGAYR